MRRFLFLSMTLLAGCASTTGQQIGCVAAWVVVLASPIPALDAFLPEVCLAP